MCWSVRAAGFTLTELAVVLAIVGLLLGGLLYTLAAQTDQRNFEETRRRLEQARELLLSFAIVHGRLPAPPAARRRRHRPPSRGRSTRRSQRAAPATAVQRLLRRHLADRRGDARFASGAHDRLSDGGLPGLAVDAWGNRIRYAVANLITNCSGSSITPG
ncbi:MAG: prepilin-type N-terminal cleavage/methylation domain-containing protein [Burkholderiales bacterium]|nr:prepilin-type N-terminal cleavage/methylation domain-containing protein [Burkholderiales bacterium]